MKKDKIKQYLLYFTARNLSNNHHKLKIQEYVSCKRSDVARTISTSNNIIYIKSNSTVGYFKECRIHMEIHEYLNLLINEYCDNFVHTDKIDEFKKICALKLSDKSNFKKIINMGPEWYSNSNIRQFQANLNSEFIGLPKPYPQWYGNQLLNFAKFLWGELEVYKYNSYLSPNEYHNYNANRSIVTRYLAELFEVEELIPDTRYIQLNIEGEEHDRFGILTEPSPGILPDKIFHDNKAILTPEFQRQTINLNILDVICYQKDHRPGNYSVLVDGNGKVLSLNAFDNDAPTTMAPSISIDFPSYQYASILKKNGEINRPHMDKKLAVRILSVTRKEIWEKVRNYISIYQYWALLIRIAKLQRAIKVTALKNPLFLLEYEDWNQNTIDEELYGDFNVTYLKYFHDKYC